MKNEFFAARLSKKEQEILRQYQEMKKQYDTNREELLLEPLENYLQNYPIAEWEEQKVFAAELRGKLGALRREQALLRHILKEENLEKQMKEQKKQKEKKSYGGKRV